VPVRAKVLLAEIRRTDTGLADQFAAEAGPRPEPGRSSPTLVWSRQHADGFALQLAEGPTPAVAIDQEVADRGSRRDPARSKPWIGELPGRDVSLAPDSWMSASPPSTNWAGLPVCSRLARRREAGRRAGLLLMLPQS